MQSREEQFDSSVTRP
nr:unnamed protein product [Callosobruchus chinensis]CAH7727184.1 unnamed protein product [Callosobruchus chinensis]CAH7728554.1 unnamed protein product [Callosobruchus chinensis]CAH7730226.1 unnamed protein product [Callosobruchus chinensis]CAH7756821.1 unnamed protein product [Callosobruchus chinensis]